MVRKSYTGADSGPHSSFDAGMAINVENDENLLLVESYGEGGFKLQERRIKGSMIVSGAGFYPLDASIVGDLCFRSLEAVAGKPLPEILLIGTGKIMQPLPKNFRQDLERNKIPYDVMDTGAAARTYNILTLEGRRVTAMMLAVT